MSTPFLRVGPWKLAKGILHTCKISGLILKNGVDIWTFVSAKITGWHRNYLILVYIWFRALNLTSYWSYAVSSSNFCAKLCTNMTLEHLEAAGAEKKWVILFPFYSKCLPRVYYWPLWRSQWLVGNIFGTNANPRSITKKWLFHPLPLFMAVSMIPNMWHPSCYYMRHSWLNWGVMLERAREDS